MKLYRIRLRVLGLLAAGVLCGMAVCPPAHALYAKFGPFRIDARLGVTVGVDYTDNVFLTQSNTEDDVELVIGPVIAGTIGFDFPMFMAFPSGQKITLSMSTSYSTSLTKNGVSEGFSAPAAASFDWPIYIGPWTFQLTDNFRFNNDPLETVFGVNNNRIDQYYNAALVSATRRFGRVSITASAQRYDQIVPDQLDLEVVSYSFALTPAVFLRENYSVYLSSNYYINEQADPAQRDSVGYFIGPGVSGQITPSIAGSLTIGYQWTELDATATEPKESHDGLGSSIALSYAQPLRPNTTHSISVFQSPGITGLLDSSDLQETLGVNYNITHLLNRWVTLSPFIAYQHVSSLSGSIEEVDIVSFGLGLSRSFGRHLSGSVWYRHQSRDSNIPGFSYDANKVSVRLTWWF